MIRAIISFAAFLLMAVILCWQGCVRPEISHNAGKGGKASLLVSAKHHSAYAAGLTYYIKYNAVNISADGVYDDSATATLVGGKPVATFSSLKKGDYVVFVTGYDMTQGEEVSGFIRHSIREEAPPPQERDIPVGGAHGND
jgi:hypothetical protein